MCGGPRLGPGVPWVDADSACTGTGWALAIPMYGGTVLGGYYPLPTQYLYTALPGAVPGLPRGTRPQEHAHMTGLDPSKEILGVDNAQYRLGIARLPHASPNARPRALPEAACGAVL